MELHGQSPCLHAEVRFRVYLPPTSSVALYRMVRGVAILHPFTLFMVASYLISPVSREAQVVRGYLQPSTLNLSPFTFDLLPLGCDHHSNIPIFHYSNFTSTCRRNNRAPNYITAPAFVRSFFFSLKQFLSKSEIIR
jgi:hypothetical protein